MKSKKDKLTEFWRHIPSAYLLMAIFLTGFTLVVISFSAFSYIEAEKDMVHEFTIQQDQISAGLSQTLSLVMEGLDQQDIVYVISLEQMNREFVWEYVASGSDPSSLDLSAIRIRFLKAMPGMDVHLYIINESGFVVDTTDEYDWNLDFRDWPEFNTIITEMREGDTFRSDPWVVGFKNPSVLKKYGYLPTPDHRYLFEVGLVREDLPVDARMNVYFDVSKSILSENPNVKGSVLVDRSSLISGNTSYLDAGLGFSSLSVDPDMYQNSLEVIEQGMPLRIESPDGTFIVDYIPISSNDEILSSSFLSFAAIVVYSTEHLYQQLDDQLRLTIATAVGVFLILLIFAYIISQYVSRPVRLMIEDIDRIAKGDVNHTIRATGGIECAQLENSINLMVERMKDDMDIVSEKTVRFNEELAYSRCIEEELRSNEETLRSILDGLPGFVHMIDSEGKIQFVSAQLFDITGYTQEEFLSNQVNYYDEPEAASIRKFVKKILAEKKSFPFFEFTGRKKEGSIWYASVSGQPYYNKCGEFNGFTFYTCDITRRHLAEQELEKSEIKFREIVEALPFPFVELDLSDPELPPLFVNKSFVNLFGPIEQSYRIWLKKACCDPECAREMVTSLGKMDEGGVPNQLENVWNILAADGSVRKIIWWLLPSEENRMHILAIDITEIQRAKALDAAYSEIMAVILSLPDACFALNNENEVIAWNHEMERLSGISQQEIFGKDFMLYLVEHPDNIIGDLLPHTLESLKKSESSDTFKTKSNSYHESFLEKAYGGRGAYLWLIANSIYDESKSYIGFIASVRDMTPVREVERDLLIRTSAIDASLTGMALLDLRYRILYANPALVRLTGADSSGSLIWKTVTELFTEGGRISDLKENMAESGKWTGEMRLIRPDGTEKDISGMMSFVHDKKWDPIAIVSLFSDITTLKKNERDLVASVREKDVFLKELHHRTKNNMQIISSLLLLSSQRFTDPEVLSAFQECQNQIKSMAMVHNSLHQTGNFSFLDMKSYIKNLVSDLAALYACSDFIHFRFDISKRPVAMDLAVYCGLILNELITNALKYAFQGRSEGTISIFFSYVGDLITLMVKDDGIGIPKDFDYRSPNYLGLNIVINLVEDQLEGSVEMIPDNGIQFIVKFRDNQD